MRFLKMDYSILSLGSLSLGAKLVLNYVLSCCNSFGKYTKGLQYMANALGMSLRQIQRLVKELEDKGLLIVNKDYRLILSVDMEQLKALISPQEFSNLVALFDAVYSQIKRD